jgi:hypothetical protein
LELLVEGPPSHPYTIEQSEDLHSWQVHSTHASSNGAVRIEVPICTGTPERFYRISKPGALGSTQGDRP